jgi:hypothetical protein
VIRLLSPPVTLVRLSHDPCPRPKSCHLLLKSATAGSQLGSRSQTFAGGCSCRHINGGGSSSYSALAPAPAWASSGWKAGWVQALAGSNPASSAAPTSGNAVARRSNNEPGKRSSLSFSPELAHEGPRFVKSGGRQRTLMDAQIAGFGLQPAARAR